MEGTIFMQSRVYCASSRRVWIFNWRLAVAFLPGGRYGPKNSPQVTWRAVAWVWVAGKTTYCMCVNVCCNGGCWKGSLTIRCLIDGFPAESRTYSSTNPLTWLLCPFFDHFRRKTTLTFGLPPTNQSLTSFVRRVQDSLHPLSKTTEGWYWLSGWTRRSGSFLEFWYCPVKRPVAFTRGQQCQTTIQQGDE